MTAQHLHMHFLSHYYTGLPENKPLFVAGVVIPDLTNGFSKAYNSVISKMPPPANNDLMHIHNGILSHYAGDKWFHNSPLFLKHLSLFSGMFQQVGLTRSRLRLSVIAHIAVEMMIDRQIVSSHKNICEAFYDTLEKASETVLRDYFDLLGLEKEKRDFLSKFNFFRERRFLFSFTDIERIVFVLNKVYSSVTSVEFTDDEKKKFVIALNNIDSEMRYSWQEILKA